MAAVLDTHPIPLSEIKLGTIVLAKHGIHPFWPAIISKCDLTMRRRRDESYGKWSRNNRADFFVHFYDTYDGAWIHRDDIINFQASATEENIHLEANVRASLQRATIEAQDRIAEAAVPRAPLQAYEGNLGDVVLARFANYPPWPGVITKSRRTDTAWYRQDIRSFYVNFIRHPTVAWVPAESIRKYSDVEALETKVRSGCPIHRSYVEAFREANIKTL